MTDYLVPNAPDGTLLRHRARPQPLSEDISKDLFFYHAAAQLQRMDIQQAAISFAESQEARISSLEQVLLD